MSENGATWLPNLIGGVSIWKIAGDLNESHMFGGRLLTPETEGSDSLPTRVEWKLSGLVPLDQARAQHGAEVETAIADFQACLKKVAKEFADENSGYHKYRSAFTVPSIEAAGSPNYFYDPKTKKVLCINWGASPRTIGGAPGQFVYDHAAWGDLFGPAAAGGVVAGAATVASTGAAPQAESKPETKEEEKNGDDKKDDDKKKKGGILPWILAGLAFLALLALILFLLKACEDQKNSALDAGSDATSFDGAASTADAAADGASRDATSGDGATDAQALGDGGTDAASADASADAASASDAGDAGEDDFLDDIDVDDEEDMPGSSSSGGGPGSSGGGGGGKGEIHIYTPTGANSKAGPHRVHVHPDATAWRVVSGMPKVGRTQARGKRYDVWLKAGQTFDGVKIEWQDKGGKWHPH